jgi:hypothetical protein
VLRVAIIAVVVALAGAADNRIKNPSLEDGRDGRPLGWRFGTAEPAEFVADWGPGGRTGKCLHLTARSGKMSGYWGQTVPVEPGKSYVLQGYYRLAGGKLLCYVHGSTPVAGGDRVSVDARFYRASMHNHWLTPVFLAPDVLAGPKPDVWYPFEVRFKVPPPMRAVSVSLGMYFTPGEVWFDDLSLVETTEGGSR